jgi:hypothetical protein
MIDCQGSYAPDGIVGPHFEKEGSYYTIRQVWCPVQVFASQPFDGKLKVENRYDFLSLDKCSFEYRYVSYPSSFESGEEKVLKEGEVKGLNVAPHASGVLSLPDAPKQANALTVTAVDPYGKELFTWTYKLSNVEDKNTQTDKMIPSVKENSDSLMVSINKRTYLFSKKDGRLQQVKVDDRLISLNNGPRLVVARRADRSFDQFYNHDDPEAEKKKTTYTLYDDRGKFVGFSVNKAANDTLVVTANYRLGSFDRAEWHFAPDGSVMLRYTYNFNGVVDLMGVVFDYPESKVKSKRWLGCGPYRVWQNRIHGPQLGVWQNKYNDPVPGESFDYPEFKGYFAGVQWMNLQTSEGEIKLVPRNDKNYVGIYQPRDGRDEMLYTLPATGISVLQVIPPVRNKVNTTDLIGPSSQPHWVRGSQSGEVVLRFE